MDFVGSKESEQLSTRGKMKVTSTVTESWWVCPQRALGAAWRRREATPHSDLGAGGQDLGPAPSSSSHFQSQILEVSPVAETGPQA